MTEKKYENLSAIMDGETELNDQLIQQLHADPELRSRWQRYHLIRDGLDNHLPDVGMSDISEKVMSALEAEPTILAPMHKRISQKVMKQAAGLAVAASVATIAIVSVQTSQLTNTPDSTTSIARIEQPRIDQTAISQARLRNQAIQSKLNGYLVNHNEYSMSARMQGMMPYMRIVGDADNQRPRDAK
ncbi:MAG: sigma-E factor negative regulatory protein [Gammaproteobacteria bacterium]|nr:sigma-E factor negative regulatory protein [Gammaproteobacteria bacterium]